MTEEDKEYWNQLFQTYKESATLFEKNFLYITSGALGVSFTFLSDIVNLESAKYFWLLIFAWSLFTIVIFISLIAHYLSMKSLNHEMKHFLEKSKPKNKFDKLVKKLNIFMIFGLPFGLFFLILFITINLTIMADHNKPIPTPSSPTQPTPGTKGIEIPQRPQIPNPPPPPNK